jgi:hypothetical protein
VNPEPRPQGESSLPPVHDLVAAQRSYLAAGATDPDLVSRTIVEGDPDELMVLGVELLRHTDAQHRILGSRLVRAVRGREADAVDALLAAFDRETDPDTLFWLISALGYTGSDRATDRLLPLADSADESIRYAVSDALSSVEELSEPAREALVRMARDADSDVRFSAVFELGAWLPQIPEFRSVVLAALDDPAPLVARTAREALDEAAAAVPELG